MIARLFCFLRGKHKWVLTQGDEPRYLMWTCRRCGRQEDV